MSKIYKHYSEEEKLSLIRSYYQSGQSKKRFCISHDICCIGLLSNDKKITWYFFLSLHETI